LLGFKAKVDMKHPKRTFILLEDAFNNNIYFGLVIASQADGKLLY